MTRGFCRNLLSNIPVLDFSLPVGRSHARRLAALSRNVTAGAHDAVIAATAVHYGYALLTRNVANFKIFAGLKLEPYWVPP
jgi:predicted nucleic acid-binding protein